jgi:hypothetical protein
MLKILKKQLNYMYKMDEGIYGYIVILFKVMDLLIQVVKVIELFIL